MEHRRSQGGNEQEVPGKIAELERLALGADSRPAKQLVIQTNALAWPR